MYPALRQMGSRVPNLSPVFGEDTGANHPSERVAPTRHRRKRLLAVLAALALSAVSRVVNTCFVERHNGTDRNRCSRKVRKTYAFSNDWEVHRAATMFSHFSYNFCWPVRTLRVKVDGRWQSRTPAMAAGLTDHVWTLTE